VTGIWAGAGDFPSGPPWKDSFATQPWHFHVRVDRSRSESIRGEARNAGGGSLCSACAEAPGGSPECQVHSPSQSRQDDDRLRVTRDHHALLPFSMTQAY
jgi:hypothetical protein